MSNTRHAESGKPLRQERYASSAAHERGLMANLVAMRCQVIDDPADREVIWFLQYVSHQPGGLKAFAEQLVAEHPGHFATEAMQAHGIKQGQTCMAAEVRVFRVELRSAFDCFLLKGERACIANLWEDEDKWNAEQEREAGSRPVSYPATAFLEHCRLAARDELEALLQELCLNPEVSPAAAGPWYCPKLAALLREAMEQWRNGAQAALPHAS